MRLVRKCWFAICLLSYPATGALAQAFRHATLDNGLAIVVAENHAVPIATVLVAVRNGSMTQGDGERGIAHLWEHLLFRSYKNDPRAFPLEAQDIDASFQATTGEEVMRFYLILPSKNTAKGIALLAHLLRKPEFSKSDLETERGVVLDEARRYQSDPDYAMSRSAARLLWGNSWSRKDVVGDSASLQSVTVSRLRTAYDQYYVPNNAALVVTGDVSSTEVIAAAQKEFGSWTRAPDPFATSPTPPVDRLMASRAVLNAEGVAHATITLMFQGPSAAGDTIAPYAADALCDALNEPGSPLQHDLVTSGVFSSVFCRYQTVAHVGPITFSGVTAPATASRALTALVDELDHLDSLVNLVTPEDLEIVRKRLQVGHALGLESSVGQANQIAYWWALGDDFDVDRYDDRVGDRGLDDLRRVARTFIVKQSKIIGVLAPSATISDLQTLFRTSNGGANPP